MDRTSTSRIDYPNNDYIQSTNAALLVSKNLALNMKKLNIILSESRTIKKIKWFEIQNKISNHYALESTGKETRNFSDFF
jgi:hypothetical protein